MKKIIDFFDKVKTNPVLKFFIYCGIFIGSIIILFVMFLLGYILFKSSNISEGVGHIEKVIGLLGMPSGIYYLRNIDKKLSKILSEECKK